VIAGHQLHLLTGYDQTPLHRTGCAPYQDALRCAAGHNQQMASVRCKEHPTAFGEGVKKSSFSGQGQRRAARERTAGQDDRTQHDAAACGDGSF
jgi:hypothetical protein